MQLITENTNTPPPPKSKTKTTKTHALSQRKYNISVFISCDCIHSYCPQQYEQLTEDMENKY